MIKEKRGANSNQMNNIAEKDPKDKKRHQNP